MRVRHCAGLALVVVLAGSGCATVCSSLSGTAKELCEKVNKPPAPEPPVEVAYLVERDKRIERVARSVEFDITPALDGTPEVEPVPVWLYAGTDPTAWNGGNNIGKLSVRVKANNTTSYEVKVGSVAGEAQEPDVQAPCQVGVTVHMKLELLDNGVQFTADGKSAFVEVATDGPHTLGVGWPPQRRQGLLGAKLENVVWK